MTIAGGRRQVGRSTRGSRHFESDRIIETPVDGGPVGGRSYLCKGVPVGGGPVAALAGKIVSPGPELSLLYI